MESFDMSGESKPNRRKLLPEGWRPVTIIDCSGEVKSKNGNNQYIIKIEDEELNYQEDVYLVSEPKKRWFLKNLLDSCGIEHKEGIYQFEPPLSKNLIGKRIEVLREHEPNEYINRENKKVITTQHRIVEFRPLAWDE